MIKRTKEFIAFTTDKSGRMSIDTKDNYREACQPHISEDEIITEETHLQLQDQANAHATFWTRILRSGESTYGEERIKKNMLTHKSAFIPL